MSNTNLTPPVTLEDTDSAPYAPSQARQHSVAEVVHEHSSSLNDDLPAFDEDSESRYTDAEMTTHQVWSRDSFLKYNLPLKRKDTLSTVSDYVSGHGSDDDDDSTVVDESEVRPIVSPNGGTKQSPLWLDRLNEGHEQAARLTELTSSLDFIDSSRCISPLTLPPPILAISSTEPISPFSLSPISLATSNTITGEQPTPIYPTIYPLRIRNFFISLDHHNARTRVSPRKIETVTDRRTGKVVVKKDRKEPPLRTIRKLTFREELAEEQDRRRLIQERAREERNIFQQRLQIANSLESQGRNVFQQETQLVMSTRHGREQEMLETQRELNQNPRLRAMMKEVGRKWKESDIGKEMMAARGKQEGAEEAVKRGREVGELRVLAVSDVEFSGNSKERETALAVQGFPELHRCPSRIINASSQEPKLASTLSCPPPQYWQGHGQNDKSPEAPTAPCDEDDGLESTREQVRDEDNFMDMERMPDWAWRTPPPNSDGPKERWQHIYGAIVEKRGGLNVEPAGDEDTWWRRPRNEAYPEKY